jgi:hypothetical protein
VSRVRRLPVIAVLALGLVLAGCTEESAGDRRAEARTAREAPTGPAETEVPATTSGPLTESDLPAPSDLGAGWETYVDRGGHGYEGNGDFVRERDAEEVAMSLVPLGCSEIRAAPGLPVPSHALEATFRGPGGRSAVALVLEYDDETEAKALIDQLGSLLASCPRPTGEVDRPTLTVDLLLPNRSTIHDVRREVGPGASPEVWSEVVVREGRRVGLTIVQSEDPAKPDGLDRVDFEALTGRLRDAVG